MKTDPFALLHFHTNKFLKACVLQGNTISLLTFYQGRIRELPEDMLSDAVRNLCENYTEHQSVEECSQHRGCLETSYRPANLQSFPSVFYTKVPGEHHELLLSCLQK